MSIKIWFDMDGTVADFYSQENWLEMLQNENAGAFINCQPLFTELFYKTVACLAAKGVQFGVITWLPMQASPEYEDICRAEKIAWCKKYLPFISDFTAQSYGIPKQNAIKKHATTEILIDDNSEVGAMWKTAKRRSFRQVSNTKSVNSVLLDILEEIEAGML